MSKTRLPTAMLPVADPHKGTKVNGMLNGPVSSKVHENLASSVPWREHSCWQASFLAFCRIYIIYIPLISFIYSMYTYNYIHIWRAARTVKNPPASNYAEDAKERAMEDFS